MNLQDNIYKYRKEKGYSQEELGVLCHVSRQAVSKWENGSSKPDSDNLVLLAKFLEVSTDTLLGIETTQSKQQRYGEMPYHEITYTSPLKIGNIPLIDVYFRVYHYGYFGKRAVDTHSRCAKGIIAIGTKAIGVFTLSFFGLGFFGIGLCNIGLIASLGILSVSALYAVGTLALSLYFSIGILAAGYYACGVLVYGMQLAVGVVSFGNHTIGVLAEGLHSYVLQNRDSCIVDASQFKNMQLLLQDTHIPEFLKFIISHIPLC